METEKIGVTEITGIFSSTNKDNDVIIKGGSTITINEHVQTKSFKVSGNTVLTLNDGISFSQPSVIEDNATVNWHLGKFTNYWPNFGVAITNKGTININRPIPSFNAPQFLELTSIMRVLRVH